MGTKSQYAVTMSATYRGVFYDLGIWDKKTGGDVEAEITKHRGGGMGEEESHGGQPSTSDVTLTRTNKRQGRNDVATRRLLRAMVGKADIVVTEQTLDKDGNSWDQPSVHRGTLKRVSGAEVDADSNETDMYEVGVSLNGTIS